MNKQDYYIFGIQEVGNCVWKIFSNELSIKYCIAHYLIEPVMAVIIVNTEEIKAVALFKDDNNRIDFLITHMEGAV